MSKTPEQKAKHAAYMKEYARRRKLEDPEYKAKVIAAAAASRAKRLAEDPEGTRARINATSKKSMARPDAKARVKERRKDPVNRVKENARSVAYAKRNREKINARTRERYASDPLFKLSVTLRSRLSTAVKALRFSKPCDTLALVGCSLPELKAHLEAQFQPGMTWENYGHWHIDHRKPVAGHDVTDEAEVRAAFHWSNLQPLWDVDNFSKHDAPGFVIPVREEAPEPARPPKPYAPRRKEPLTEEEKRARAKEYNRKYREKYPEANRGRYDPVKDKAYRDAYRATHTRTDHKAVLTPEEVAEKAAAAAE